MSKYLQLVLDWSEVWALLIPLGVLLYHSNQPSYLKPVIAYLWIALFLNLLGDFIGDFKKHLPQWLQSNNPLYNIHSIVRFICFSIFFLALKQPHFQTIKKILPVVSLVFIVVNFTFVDDFFHYESLSGNLLSAEAYILLVYCVLYYLSQLKEEVDVITSGPDFWVTTGLSIYVVINFFVFLFYVPMLQQNIDLAISIWNVHNVAYIFLSFFIARAFYVSSSTGYRA